MPDPKRANGQDDDNEQDRTQPVAGITELPEEQGGGVEVVDDEAPPPQRRAQDDDKGDDREDDDKGVEQDDDGERRGRPAQGAADDGLTEEQKARRAKRQRARDRAREREAEKDNLILSLQDDMRRLMEQQTAMQRRNIGMDMAHIDNELRTAQAQIEEATKIIEEGVAAQNGKAVAQAQQALFNAQRRLDHFSHVKRRFVERPEQSAPPMDPGVARNARAWATKNGWYDPNGGDRDSRRVLRIDQELMEEGDYNPRSQAYWNELDRRVRKEMPHLFEDDRGGDADRDDDDDDADKGRGGRSITTGSGRDSNPEGGGKGTYRLSAARVAAMKEAGMWDEFQTDPKVRKRMLARFREQDAIQAQNRR